MALIDNHNLTTGIRGRRQMNESELTKLWIERGVADLAPSEKRWLAAGTVTTTATPAATTQDGPGEKVARAKPSTPGPTPQHGKTEPPAERHVSLADIAERITGKRQRKR